LEAKLGNAVKAENPIAPQLVQLISSIRSSVNELEKTKVNYEKIVIESSLVWRIKHKQYFATKPRQHGK